MSTISEIIKEIQSDPSAKKWTIRTEDLRKITAEQDALTAQLAEARAALAKCDPWKQVSERPLVFVCACCNHEYNQLGETPEDTHEPDCIWLAAVIAHPKA